jgi:hypothetical protein
LKEDYLDSNKRIREIENIRVEGNRLGILNEKGDGEYSRIE